MLLQTGQAFACGNALRALVGGQVILALFARAYEFEVEDVDEPWFQGFKCAPYNFDQVQQADCLPLLW